MPKKKITCPGCRTDLQIDSALSKVECPICETPIELNSQNNEQKPRLVVNRDNLHASNRCASQNCHSEEGDWNSNFSEPRRGNHRVHEEKKPQSLKVAIGLAIILIGVVGTVVKFGYDRYSEKTETQTSGIPDGRSAADDLPTDDINLSGNGSSSKIVAKSEKQKELEEKKRQSELEIQKAKETMKQKQKEKERQTQEAAKKREEQKKREAEQREKEDAEKKKLAQLQAAKKEDKNAEKEWKAELSAVKNYFWLKWQDTLKEISKENKPENAKKPFEFKIADLKGVKKGSHIDLILENKDKWDENFEFPPVASSGINAFLYAPKMRTAVATQARPVKQISFQVPDDGILEVKGFDLTREKKVKPVFRISDILALKIGDTIFYTKFVPGENLLPCSGKDVLNLKVVRTGIKKKDISLEVTFMQNDNFSRKVSPIKCLLAPGDIKPTYIEGDKYTFLFSANKIKEIEKDVICIKLQKEMQKETSHRVLDKQLNKISKRIFALIQNHDIEFELMIYDSSDRLLKIVSKVQKLK